MVRKNKKIGRSRLLTITILLFVITQVAPIYLKQLKNLSVLNYLSKDLMADSFTNASDTLSNSRLSYRAGVSSGTSGASLVTIDGSGNADNNTTHLFPRDVLCFSSSLLNGCQGQTTYTVAGLPSSTTLTTTSPLTGTLSANDFAIATQSAIHTIVFTLTNTVPIGGDLLITVPAVNVDAKTNDGFPDTASTLATNGFDLNSVGTSNVSIASSSCTNAHWGSATVTDSDGSTGHIFRFDRVTSTCPTGNTITVTIGDGTNKMINPAPYGSHTQGTADYYQINIKTRNGADDTLDNSDVVVAPIESVLVSATVDEILNFSIAGVASATGSMCGQTTDVTSTVASVPWGTISTVNSFLEAAQLLTVSTNADAGYTVKVEENDQLNKETDACDSPASGTANYTDSCIQDTTCGASACDESTSADWTSASSYPGFGYSMQGTDTAFTYNESSRTFSAKQFADQENSEAKATIMTNAGPVSGSAAHVCYRISITGLQPAGYYQNVVKYTATAIF